MEQNYQAFSVRMNYVLFFLIYFCTQTVKLEIMGSCCEVCFETSVEISAPAEKVYRILTDFERYSYWNPFIVEASKDTETLIANKTIITIKMENSSTFKPILKSVKENESFAWTGVLGCCPGVADGYHTFEITPLNNDKTIVKFRNIERMNGCLVGCCCCCADAMLSSVKAGNQRMNEALKKKCESD